jgi:hypothetical protein
LDEYPKTEDNMSSQAIGCSDFCIDLKPIKGLILFPSLGTPAVIEPTGQLTIFLALQKADIMGSSLEPGAPIPLNLARQLYFQTRITTWTDRGRDYTSYKSYSDELACESAECKRFYKCNDDVSKLYEEKKFGGFYVGKFQKNKEFLVQYYPLGDAVQPPQGPFGVIHKAAVNMYLDGLLTGTKVKKEGENKSGSEENDDDKEGYRYVFQVTVRECLNLNTKGLYELFFLYINLDNYKTARENWQDNGRSKFKTEVELHEHYLTNPGDELLTEALIEELNSKAKKLGCEPIIKPIEFKRHAFMTPATIKFVKLYSSEPTAIMTQGQKNQDGIPDPSRGGGEKYLHYLSDSNDCWLALSRHPVYVTDKEYLDIGVASDLHLSSRQTSYKVVAPQVIHGADESDSPYISKLSHKTLETSQRMINTIGAESDALIVAGDVFDVLRNLDPRILKSIGSEASEEGAPKEIKMSTAELWEYLDFKKYDYEGPNYPFYIDALMFMTLILDYYFVLRKPLFYLTGNHEGWEVPYGISPRILNNNIVALRANPGIPSDQNLTFYEAALLFGKKYSYLGYVTNFDKKNMSWAYRWITPWKDCLVNCGKNQNILILGWGDDENFILPYIVGGGGLPRAGLAFTDNQLSLLEHMVSQEDKSNVLASHFTYANFDNTIPLHTKEQEFSGTSPLFLEKSDTGSFEENRRAVYSYLTSGKVKFTVSGHSHRAGAYTCLSDGQILGLELSDSNGEGQGVELTESRRALKSVEPQEQFGSRVACLVSGTCGLYSYQNLNNSKHSDIDKPQGIVVKHDSFGNIAKIKYIRDDISNKPRLAVRCDYLWYEERIEMFYNGKGVKGDIVVENGDGPGRKYNICLNPKWLYFLNGENIKGGGVLPIKSFTLHFVSITSFIYYKDYAVSLEIESGPTYPLSNHGDVPVYRLNVGPDDVNRALKKSIIYGVGEQKSKLLFFLSVHFNPSHPIGVHYDLDSPWCYPVRIGVDSEHITRKLGRSGELPDYNRLGKIPEYRSPKSQR